MSDNDQNSQPVSEERNPGSGFGCAALIGLVVAFAPLVFLDVRVSWAALFISVPIGIVIAVAGFAGSLVSAAQGSSDGSGTNLDEMLGESSSRDLHEQTEHTSPWMGAARNWDMPPSYPKNILILNVVATIVIVVATVINIVATVSKYVGPGNNSLAATIILGQVIPVLLAVWLLILAIKTHQATGTPAVTTRFALLERVQRIVGIGSSVWFFVVLIGSNTAGYGQSLVYAVAGLAPTVTGVIAMTVTLYMREKMEKAAIEKGDNSHDP